MSPFFAKIILLASSMCIIGTLILTMQHKSRDEPKQRYHGHVRQHGVYWVWHNYMRGTEDLIANESVTITTHGTYMDLGLLPSLLKRWEAPISLSIYANGQDYTNTIESLAYLNDCLHLESLIRRFVTIHLVFHSSHMPLDLKRATMWKIENPSDCSQPPPYAKSTQLVTYWRLKQLPYPVNLLRNVARLNIRTYYVLALDLQLLPTPNFPKKFLKFTWEHDTWRFADIKKPYTTVFCLPTFAHAPGQPLPSKKEELRKALKEYNTSVPRYNTVRQRRQWLNEPNAKDELFIFSRTKNMDMCVAYVSINELEPLYDERCVMESIYDRGTNLKGKLLMALNYTFINLDGAFLLHRYIDSWQSLERAQFQPTDKVGFFQMLWSWKYLYKNLVPLLPEDFSQGWILRSRMAEYMYMPQLKTKQIYN